MTSADNLVGGGLTMEGINQNYVVYQFAIERMWSTSELKPFSWWDPSWSEWITVFV